ncbi:MAG: PAS domain-containing protein [Deltaproteobacteria bacterium]|nr:PAS domain-containing protein [Deltaproteobacteria bacterium]
MKFSTKFTLLSAGIIFAAVFSISYFVYLSTASMLEEQIKGQLTNHAAHMADKIDRVLYNKYLDVKFLASDPVMRGRGSSLARINARLKEFVDMHKTYASASFFNLERVRLADTAGKGVGVTHPLTLYWKDINGGKEFSINVSESVSLEKNAVHFAHVVKDSRGVPFKLVVARMPIERFFDMIEPPSGIEGAREEFEVDMVDRNGLLLYSNHNEKGVLKEKLPDWGLFNGHVTEGAKAGAMPHTDPGEEEEIYVYARERGFMDFKGEGWTIIWDIPKGRAFAPVIKLRDRLLIGLTFVSASMLVMLYYVTRRVTRPLERLAKASAEVMGGNFDARLDTDYRADDEIGALIGSFNLMLNGLRDYRGKAVAYGAELEKGLTCLADAQRIAHLGNWDWDIANNTLWWSDEIYRIFGLKPRQFGATYEAFLDSVHPDDRDFVKQEVFDALYKKKTYSIDHRIVLPDKTGRIVHEEAEVTFTNGIPVRMMGTVLDITRQKEAESEMRRLNSELHGALDKVKLLSGMLPICASCKKIRDDKGYWNQIEEYIGARSEAEFTHSFCPECARRLYPGIYKG